MDSLAKKKTNSFILWLVDDEREIYTAMMLALRGENQVRRLRWYACCADAVAAAEVEPPPDIILLDFHLPGTNGVESIPILRELFPFTKIIMLTVEADYDKILRAAGSGASGYLLKPFRLQEMMLACQRALQGGMTIDPAVMPILFQNKPPSQEPIFAYGISGVELRVLQCVVRGLTDRQIAEFHDMNYFTVRNHVRVLHKKFGTQKRSQLIAKIINERLL